MVEVCEIQKEQVDARGCEMTRSPEAFKKVPLHQAAYTRDGKGHLGWKAGEEMTALVQSLTPLTP